jgi:hexokinase
LVLHSPFQYNKQRLTEVLLYPGQRYINFEKFSVVECLLTNRPLFVLTQGFTASGAAGQDVVKLLQDALERRKVNVYVAALVNDTVGTLLSHAYQSGASVAGAIFGTGTNGAYLEKSVNIKKEIPSRGNHEYMVVNTEWGAFDNEVGVVQTLHNKLLLQVLTDGVYIITA